MVFHPGGPLGVARAATLIGFCTAANTRALAAGTSGAKTETKPAGSMVALPSSSKTRCGPNAAGGQLAFGPLGAGRNRAGDGRGEDCGPGHKNKGRKEIAA